MNRKQNVNLRDGLRVSFRAFIAGALGYCALETLWRGRTCAGMGAVGGICMAVFCAMRRKHRGGLLSLCLRGGLLITAAELLYGIFWNGDRKIWDYSRLPLNWRGQICAGYFVLWCLLCIPMCGIARLLEDTVGRVDRSARK